MRATQTWTPGYPGRVQGPLFGGRAPEMGALSMLCAPITAGPAVIGSLCLISETAGAFDDQAQDLAALFAACSDRTRR